MKPQIRRLNASILELMLLVAAAAVSFRWPGLSVPVGLLFLYALTQRRDILGQPTRVALAQVALVPKQALYINQPALIIHACAYWCHRRSFHAPGPGLPFPVLNLSHSCNSVLSSFGGLGASEHPDSDFEVAISQHNSDPCSSESCSRSTNRRNTACQGFQDRKR
jgi:hypothetical protein